MQTAWFQRLLTGIGALPRELGRLPEYAGEAERLHREILAAEERLAASGEKLPPPGVIDAVSGWPVHGL